VPVGIHAVPRNFGIKIRMGNSGPGAAELFDQAKMLDRYYIPTRYPNSFAQGSPKDYFTQRDVEEAIHCTRNIIAFCERHLGHAEGVLFR
jgi:HEPN domain